MARFRGLSLMLFCATLVGAGVAYAGAAPGGDDNRFGLSAPALDVYRRWVLATCLGDSPEQLGTQLRAQASELAPAFRRAVAEGPTEAEIRDVETAAAMLFDRRGSAMPRDVPITGVSRADLTRFTRQDKAAFVADQGRRFATGYRANAVAALGTLRDAASLALLARIARDRRDPLSAAAREALRSDRAVQ